MKANTNIGFELWYSVLNVCFLSNPIVLGIKLKQKIRTLQLHFLFCFYLMSEDVRIKTKKFDTHSYPFLLLRSVKYRILASTYLDFRLDHA